MTDQVLDILKLVLLALLYLFFARVLWAVWSEVRQPAGVRPNGDPPPPIAVPSGRRSAKPPKGRGGTPARLVVLEPKERKGTAFAITPAGVAIGRDSDNTIVIGDDAYVSGHHAKLVVTDGQVVLHDLSSRNGTYLNSTRLDQQRTVQTGDRIQIGYTLLEAQ